MLLERVRRLVRDNARRLDALAATVPGGPADRLAAFARDPAELFRGTGIEPDPWQRDLLRSTARRVLMLTARQCGKSTTAGFLALRDALTTPGLTALVVSPSLRQSAELFRRAMDAFTRLGRPVGVAAESVTRVEFANRSRIISLPASEGSIRGFTAGLVILDEAARIPDAMVAAVRPMLAVSGGRLVCLSTAFAKSGFFYEQWTGPERWERVRVTAEMNPRITPEFLAEERRVLGPRLWAMEYGCEFGDDIAAVFSTADIRRAVTPDVRPLFGPGRTATSAGVPTSTPPLVVAAGTVDATPSPLFGR